MSTIVGSYEDDLEETINDGYNVMQNMPWNCKKEKKIFKRDSSGLLPDSLGYKPAWRENVAKLLQDFVP